MGKGPEIGRRSAAVAVALVAFLMAVPSIASAAATVHVTVQNHSFMPGTETIAVGDSVEWDWLDAPYSHTTTSDATSPVSWSAPLDATHSSYTKQFNTAGEFTYHCNIHAYMQGDIVAGTVFDFSMAQQSVGEGAGTATIDVERKGDTSQALNVDYATSDGTATEGQDYTAASSTLSFGAGDASASFEVTILQDSTHESNETVHLTLSNPQSPAALGAVSTSILTIQDDDPAPTTYQPDAQVKGPHHPAYLGDDVYGNLSKQTLLAKVTGGNEATFRVRIQNDGTGSDAFWLNGTKSSTRFSVRYLLGSTDVTKAVAAGTASTSMLVPGTSAVLQVIVKPKASTPVGALERVVLGATSKADGTKKDAVRVEEKLVS